MAFVSIPSVVFPHHVVTKGDVERHYRAVYGDEPDFEKYTNVLQAANVSTRHLAISLEEVRQQRNSFKFTQYAVSVDLAARASEKALSEAGLAASQVDLLIVSSSSSYSLPGLDAELVNHLHLRPNVRRLTVAQAGCAGGVSALIQAMDYLRAYPDARILITCVDLFGSAFFANSDRDMGTMVFRSLFGDGAGACVISRIGDTGLQLLDEWQHTLPQSQHYLRCRMSRGELQVLSNRDLARAPHAVAPHLKAWMSTFEEWNVRRPGFLLAHPGGPRILEGLTEQLGLDQTNTTHSWASLQENGNLASVSILDVIRRTYLMSPKPGSDGLLIAFGPGFTTAAIRALWL
ncbi:hypothetical protein [Streptomyces djakartensis]|uniref:hypothetical protein n=1 Tax=Streptomyces djakartensis TaxID=68193 RepID=UPI0034DE88F2